jgi:hypothetical protein
MPSGGSNNKRMLLIVVVCVVVLGLAVALFFILHNKKSSVGSSNTNSTAQSSQATTQLSLLSQYGSHLQAGDLSKFDKQALFYAVFKSAAMQTVVNSANDRYQGTSAQDQTSRSLEFLHQASFNYQTKDLSLSMSDAQGSYNTRCIKGQWYTYDDVNAMAWTKNTSSTGSDCTADSYVYNINDGVNTGGLSASQAQTFVSAIQNSSGLVSVDTISYVTHGGAPFIRLVVTIHPVNTGANGYQGLGVFLGAFQKNSLSPQTWPYSTIGSLATGAKLIYYINPATQLPAYSQVGLTYYVSDSTGQQLPNRTYDFQDTVYSFGGSVPTLPTTDKPQPIKLSWPEEKMQ